MTQLFHRPLGMLAVIGTITMLAACGGGNDEPPPEEPVQESVTEPVTDEPAPQPTVDVASKYAGAWASDCFTQDGFSAVVRADFARGSATRITGNVVINAYFGTSCAGPVVQSEQALTNLNLNYDGTKAVGSATAEKFSGRADQGTARVLLALRGNTLRIGDPDGSRDAQGYPNAFYSQTLQRL